MKKILNVALVVIMLICTFTLFTACTTDTKENRNLAEQLALQRAKDFVASGSLADVMKYNSARVTNIKYSFGKYIVDVDLYVDTIYYISGNELHGDATIPFTYTIEVSKGVAEVTHTEYHDVQY